MTQNLDAERSTIGSILIDPFGIHVAAEILTPDDFSDHRHGIIFMTMMSLARIDLVTVKERLDGLRLLDLAGGAAYIASLVDGVPRSFHVETYADIVKEQARVRRLEGRDVLAFPIKAREIEDLLAMCDESRLRSMLQRLEVIEAEAAEVREKDRGYTQRMEAVIAKLEADAAKL